MANALDDAPQPQPEPGEPRLHAPGLTDLSMADWRAIVLRAGREAMDDNVPMIASALAYSAFFAIPSVLLVVLGLFTLFADATTVAEVVNSLASIAPADVANLLGDSLVRLTTQPTTSVMLTLVGLALAVWATTSAMTTCMTALNLAYERRDRRSFLRKRLTALVMAASVGAAGLLGGGLLVLGPHLEHWLGQVLGAESPPALQGGVAPVAPPSAAPYYMSDHLWGEYTLLRRNPNYTGPRPALLDAIVLREGISDENAVALVDSGTWDGALLHGALFAEGGKVERHAEDRDDLRYESLSVTGHAPGAERSVHALLSDRLGCDSAPDGLDLAALCVTASG